MWANTDRIDACEFPARQLLTTSAASVVHVYTQVNRNVGRKLVFRVTDRIEACEFPARQLLTTSAASVVHVYTQVNRNVGRKLVFESRAS